MNPTLAQITKELLASYERHPRKRLGQHFLVDPHVVQRILKVAELTKTDHVLEIGTGLGILTKELADHVQKVITVEVDKELLKIAKEVLKDYANIEFIHGDFLKIDWTEFCKPETKGLGFQNFKIVANLPYYITAPTIEKILSWNPSAGPPFALAVLMLQKEVA